MEYAWGVFQLAKGISKYNHYQSADQLTNLIASERRVIYS